MYVIRRDCRDNAVNISFYHTNYIFHSSAAKATEATIRKVAADMKAIDLSIQVVFCNAVDIPKKTGLYARSSLVCLIKYPAKKIAASASAYYSLSID